MAQELEDKAQHVFLLLGSGGQKEKREKLAALRAVPANETLVVVATGKYVGEGFDEPRLDTILLTMPVSWKGTLAQYVGRLHRNYEGKREVRVYDYVDIHIPMLERMYHKRLKGYVELGYQVKMSGQDASVSQIYDGQDYFVPFTTDLGDAAAGILIVSPFLKMARIYAVIDRSVVWYGSIDYLSYSVKDANALRFENADIAGELLDLLRPPEQMQIEQLI